MCKYKEIQWYAGTMVHWYIRGTVVVHWNADTMVHWGIDHIYPYEYIIIIYDWGKMPQWHADALVQWWYNGTMVQWWYSSTLVQWYPGTKIHWNSGAVV